LANTPQSYSNTDLGHLQMGGGLNLRAYSGYYIPVIKNGFPNQLFAGYGGTALNVELDFENYLNLKPKFCRNWLHINVYAFADGGSIQAINTAAQSLYNSNSQSYMTNIYDDAGLGIAFTIKKWGVFEKAKPLTLRVDFPFYANQAPLGTDNITMRYVIGINRAF
jgi:aminopeptidase N